MLLQFLINSKNNLPITQTRNRFPKSRRLLNSSDFDRLQRSSQRCTLKHFVIVWKPNQLPHSRLGLIVSKKIDKRAVIRNKIKRRLRELFRNNSQITGQGFDIIIIARQNAAQADFSETEKQFGKGITQVLKDIKN